MSSPYKAEWQKREGIIPNPSRMRNVKEYDFFEFEKAVYEADPEFVHELVDSIYQGDLFILRNAFSAEFMRETKERAKGFFKASPSSFHKILQGCPDFHRVIDTETAKNYTFKSIRHSSFYFPWNNDPLGIRAEVMRRWRVCKYLSGFRKDEWETNLPKDGVVDRIQVAYYPTEIGESEMHSDPIMHQKLFISAYMSKKGVDYKEGGFYCLNTEDKVVDCEPLVNVGDLAFGYASVVHGVAKVDPHVPVNWASDQGRWWIGLYSISSNEMPESDRARGFAVPPPASASQPGVLAGK